jgi:hypothetical protein
LRSYLKYLLAGSALIALVSPAWARTEHMTLNLQTATMIGSTQVPAGEYVIQVDDGKTDLTVLGKGGKVVTEAHGDWVKLPQKAQDSEVQYDGGHLIQVQFAGQPEAFHIS